MTSDISKQNIDIIKLLIEKTKGNLNEDEKKLTDQVMLDLQNRFVEASRA